MPRVTAQKTRQGQADALKGAIASYGIYREFGTTRIKTAAGQQKRGKAYLVGTDQYDKKSSQNVHEEIFRHRFY
jgi:hypothetical protein